MGVIEASRARIRNYNDAEFSYESVFVSDNNIYNYDGFNGANTNTKVWFPMPSTTR